MDAPSTYVDPTHLYYAGKLSLEEATKREIAIAQAERRWSASPDLNRILRVLGWVVFPIAILLSLIAERNRR
jgi:hypothetical protein